ncbi:hypothetical protein T02_2411 [Trichinella nativa]|uniref:Uncharacterized protein n=1 Tax=Trichinella nativa TaxID=6335 RepID=A0A0V1L888_9BILA|nr:hypothetical protein T02_2411 [Trichinella nativa]
MYNLWHRVWEIGHIIEGTLYCDSICANSDQNYFGKIEEEEAAAAAALLLKVIKLNNTIIAPRKMMMFLRSSNLFLFFKILKIISNCTTAQLVKFYHRFAVTMWMKGLVKSPHVFVSRMRAKILWKFPSVLLFLFSSAEISQLNLLSRADSALVNAANHAAALLKFLLINIVNGLKVSSCDDYSFIAANNEPFGHIFTMVCSSLLCFLEEPVNLHS